MELMHLRHQVKTEETRKADNRLKGSEAGMRNEDFGKYILKNNTEMVAYC